MMDTNLYALFSANAYAASLEGESLNVSRRNEIPVDANWAIRNEVNNATGFLARAYSNGGNEIVIAYAGTTYEPGIALLDWTQGNIPAALGLSLAPQILDAARFYLDVLKANPGANITFIGHSLGGGLASLMAVYFNRPAYTFDEAPFERSADSDSVFKELKQALGASYSHTPLGARIHRPRSMPFHL